ncbi:glutamate racemase [Desulfallas thermosapovorans]|uniref:Glutamate racemase n=1 Tax=Desulfallas thermosapovorans DSM 6562 TaxID=1121431 RepID=A0A5S4ZWE3_9FIRM|nr:glutamate racemase [Desulfallas thermosapovorans]TYO97335.1 glutamate racemase [Desulfallas thermosapovorans DSM 6562]
MPNPNPIGIFDSGVGGISVLKEIRRLLPGEDFLYFADSAHCPYGVKPPENIRRRITKITEFLIGSGAKVIVAACNTASIAGLDYLRRHFSIPIVGMEPAIKPAAEITRNGKVGVLATGVTINGERFNSLLTRFAGDIEVINVPCPGLVEQVEMGLLNAPETAELLHKFLNPLIKSAVDTVVLGCTHYPFLRPLVESIMGPEVKVIDTGCAVAKRVHQVLQSEDLLAESAAIGTGIFYTSGNPKEVGQIIRRLWDQPDITVEYIDI